MLEKTKEAIKNEQSETLATLGTQETGAIKNEQSETLATLGTQDTGAIKNEQSEKLATFGTQGTGRRQTKLRGNQEWTIQRN
jgi:hypothetical protein